MFRSRLSAWGQHGAMRQCWAQASVGWVNRHFTVHVLTPVRKSHGPLLDLRPAYRGSPQPTISRTLSFGPVLVCGRGPARPA